jgi:hypothetical protein
VAFWNRKKSPSDELGTLPHDERFRMLERKHRALEEDLDDLHDRFKRFQGRAVKRAALDAAEPPSEPAPPSPDDASARILSLRQRAKVRPGGVR